MSGDYERDIHSKMIRHQIAEMLWILVPKFYFVLMMVRFLRLSKNVGGIMLDSISTGKHFRHKDKNLKRFWESMGIARFETKF